MVTEEDSRISHNVIGIESHASKTKDADRLPYLGA